MTSMSDLGQGFFVAPFSVDGESEGVAYVDCGDLSKRWTDACADFLAIDSPAFDRAWDGALSHIRTRFTSAHGAALVTFTVSDRVAASIGLASGVSPEADSQTLSMLVDSLRGTNLVKVATRNAEPFSEALSMGERPLMFVVPWPDTKISSQDHELVRELSTHLAGAFFAKTLHGPNPG